MDNLKIQSIFPSSISQISYAGESQFGGLPIPQRQEALADYQIKINGPETKLADFDDQKHDRQGGSNFHIEQPILARPIQAEYNTGSTGYYLNKDSFSQDQILKAFNIIDVNKDNSITEDDLTFVLEYIREQFTQEEVRQMIDMISADKKHVSFEQFKKLGRGEIIPLAKYKTNGKKLKQKGIILSNLERTQLIGQDPSFLVECLKKDAISYSKYEQSKKGTKVLNNAVKIETNVKQKIFQVINLRSQNEVRERRQLFLAIVVTNIEDLMQNYIQFKDTSIGIQKVSNILQISPKEARELYPNVNQIQSLLVMIQAIVYSRQSLSRKLQLCLDMANNSNTVSLSEIVYIIQIIKGKDESVDKKLQAILRSRKIEEPVSKRLAYEVVLQYSNRFFGSH